MAAEFVFRTNAVVQLDAIDAKVRRRILKKLTWFAQQAKPLQFAGRLTNARLGTYRFRIGDYRVIVDEQRSKIIVLDIGHRREIYRP